MLIRPLGMRSGIGEEVVAPGDLIAGGETIAAITTAGAGTWDAASIATGIIRRSGPGGGYTDTTDTAANILAALAGNNAGAEIVPGTTFRMLFQNTVAQAMTFAAGAGVVAGVGTLNCAASLVREYLWTVLNAGPTYVAQGNTTNASPTVTFVFPPGVTSYKMGSSPIAVNITPGMTVSGTGITAGTKVLGVTQGLGGITGIVLDANATATSGVGGVSLTFGPTLKIDGLRSSTL